MFSLGQRIRELRLKKGITQMELAKELCTPSMISQIEADRARPSYKILTALAERLDVSVDHLLSDVEMHLEYVAAYKMARAMVADRRYEPAIPLLQELLDRPRGVFPLSDIMQLLAECYLHTDQMQQAETLLKELETMAVFHHDHRLMAQALLGLSRIDCSRKQFFVAVYRLERACEELDKLQVEETGLKAKILYNLGQVYAKSGQIREAQTCYERALAHYEGMERLPEVGKVYLNLSIAYKELKDLVRAVEYAERAEGIFKGLREMGKALQLQVSVAGMYAETGREEEALSILESSILQLRELGLAEEEGMAQVELAKICYQSGDWSAIEEACDLARNLLPELHIGQAWVHRLRGRIELQNGDKPAAVRKLEQAADLCMALGEMNEWDGVMREIASLHAEEMDMEKAFATLFASHQHMHEVLSSRGIIL